MFDEFTITRGEDMTERPVLHLGGRMDATGAQQLREECAALLEQGVTRLVVSMDEVAFVASSGLGTFLLINDEFKQQDGLFVMTGVGDTVRQVIELMNLDQFLDIRGEAAEVFGELAGV